MKSKFYVFLLTIGIFLAIIIIGLVARKSLSIHNNNDVLMASTLIKEDKHKKATKEIYKLDSYLIYLQDYLRDYKVSLNAEEEARKDDLLQELETIANLEKKNDIKAMSIDGREIAISLLKNIYGIYGISISMGLDGDIQQVNDPLGNAIYHSEEETLKTKLQLINFIIVISINFILLALSIFIGRKSKIHVKDVDIYGLDKKKYA